MSAIHNIRFKECKVRLVRLTKEEIEKYTGKTYNEAEEIADSTTDHKPIIFVREDIQNESTMVLTNMESAETSEEEDSDQSDMEMDENKETEDTYAGSNILIDNMNLQEYDMNTNELTEDTSYMENYVEMNENELTEDTSYMENSVEMNDSCSQIADNNMYAERNNFMPSMKAQYFDITNELTEDTSYMENFAEMNENELTEDTSYMENSAEMNENELTEDTSYMENSVEMNETGGNDTQTNGYIHNVIIKQEPHDEGYDVYAPQVAGSSLMIKQEPIDESYNQSYVTQGNDNMYGEYIPNILVNEPTQNFGMQSYINPETSNITNGSNSYVIIKQEILDEGNIETYTDVLRPSADQEYEDGGPW